MLECIILPSQYFWRFLLLPFQNFDHSLPFFSLGKTSSFHWCSPSVIEMETTYFKIRLVRICFQNKEWAKLVVFCFFGFFSHLPFINALFYYFFLSGVNFSSPLSTSLELQYSLFFWAFGHNFYLKPIHTLQYMTDFFKKACLLPVYFFDTTK